ncbi:MAG: RepB family DNA primase [Desulfobacteraceae bacterium]|nr:RepB family DNA primase [Desulfobacteraceae bacterium]
MERILQKICNYFNHRFTLAVLDESTGRWPVTYSPKNIPYLKAENAGGRHILIKPDSAIQPYYLLADDLDSDLLTRHHQLKSGIFKPGRMVIETSPGNYQVWIHSSRHLDLAEKRYWLGKLHSDPGADPKNRWGRCPGFRNRKVKHKTPSGQYPLAKLVWVDWKRQANIPEIKLSPCFQMAFSHKPRGACVIKTILPGPFIIKVTNPPQILHMLWLSIEEDLTEQKSTIVLSRKGRIGIIM